MNHDEPAIETKEERKAVLVERHGSFKGAVAGVRLADKLVSEVVHGSLDYFAMHESM